MHEATIKYGAKHWQSEASVKVTSINPGEILLEFAGELDIYSTPEIEGEFQPIIEKERHSHLILDLTDVVYADTTFLHLLEKLSEDEQRSISLIAPGGNIVRHLLDKLGLTAQFVVRDPDVFLTAT